MVSDMVDEIYMNDRCVILRYDVFLFPKGWTPSAALETTATSKSIYTLLCQDVDSHEGIADALGLMLIERRRCNEVALEHMRLHQTKRRCPEELI